MYLSYQRRRVKKTFRQLVFEFKGSVRWYYAEFRLKVLGIYTVNTCIYDSACEGQVVGKDKLWYVIFSFPKLKFLLGHWDTETKLHIIVVLAKYSDCSGVI